MDRLIDIVHTPTHRRWSVLCDIFGLVDIIARMTKLARINVIMEFGLFTCSQSMLSLRCIQRCLTLTYCEGPWLWRLCSWNVMQVIVALFEWWLNFLSVDLMEGICLTVFIKLKKPWHIIHDILYLHGFDICALSFPFHIS